MRCVEGGGWSSWDEGKGSGERRRKGGVISGVFWMFDLLLCNNVWKICKGNSITSLKRNSFISETTKEGIPSEDRGLWNFLRGETKLVRPSPLKRRKEKASGFLVQREGGCLSFIFIICIYNCYQLIRHWN